MSQERESIANFLRVAESITPPKFDHIAVRDERVLRAMLCEAKPWSSGDSIASGLLGIPVLLDVSVEVGVIEFRLGERLYKRLLLAELRA